jgi:hypothetical protein
VVGNTAAEGVNLGEDSPAVDLLAVETPDQDSPGEAFPGGDSLAADLLAVETLGRDSPGEAFPGEDTHLPADNLAGALVEPVGQNCKGES